MKGDFTKFRFDPTERFNRVLKQQGRVDLDSDWNEYNDIRHYQERTSRVDTLGHYGAPVDSGDAGFQVGYDGTDLTFTAGRLYVEGLQCELFAAIKYPNQPFLPNPPALVKTPNTTTAVYLDVWERHITAVEDNAIQEIALGGPDTTTRVQTIFQIRLQQSQGNVTKCNQIPTAPASGGQMTPTVQPAPPPDDPCQLAPTGGYTGLENRLYRVEIHDGGALGTATFKWSRDNGSVVFPITAFPSGEPKKVQVSKLGRDQVLAFHFNDWVEVLGDETELSGGHGTLAQITNIDPTVPELTLSNDVSAHAGEQHPKVRRWDQPSDAIPTAAGPIPLEDGIQVSFFGSNFLVGDYWTFAARTLQPSQLEPEPRSWPPLQPENAPAGIQHFYVPLALVFWPTGGGNPEIHDCRPKHECCCCTVTVGDGVTSHGDFTTIQDALASFGNSKDLVEICLLPGSYTLGSTVAIPRGNLIIRGCGERSVVIAPAAGPAFSITGLSAVTFESVNFSTMGSAPVLFASCDQFTVTGCQFSGAGAQPWLIIAQGSGLRFRGNTLLRGGLWIQEGSSSVLIRDNNIGYGAGPGIGLGGLAEGMHLIEGASGVVTTEITRNLITNAANSGVTTVFSDEQPDQFGDIEDLVIAGNTIEDCATAAPIPRFSRLAVAGILLENAQYVSIQGNRISGNGAANGIPACGIFARSVLNLEIESNRIDGNGTPVESTKQFCLDFTQMAAGTTITNPYLDVTSATLTLVNNTLKTANLIATQGGTALDCTDGAEFLLPFTPATSATATVAFPSGVAAGGNAVLTAFDGNFQQVATQTVQAAGGTQSVTLSGAQPIILVTVTRTGTPVGLQKLCFQGLAPGTTYQAGVVADLATADAGGVPALRIHENLIATPAGQSLWVTRSKGPMSIVNNSLTTADVYLQPGALFQPLAVNIGNLGFLFPLPGQATGVLDIVRMRFQSLPSVQPEAAKLLDGRVLFRGNQINFTPDSEPPWLGILSLIYSFDDVSIEGNEFETTFLFGLLVDVLAFSLSLRTSENRFWELPFGALLSFLGFSFMMNVSDNQAMNCICGYVPKGSAPMLRIVQDNQVLKDAFKIAPQLKCDGERGICATLQNLLGL